jgi:hypothetical protein
MTVANGAAVANRYADESEPKLGSNRMVSPMQITAGDPASNQFHEKLS